MWQDGPEARPRVRTASPLQRSEGPSEETAAWGRSESRWGGLRASINVRSYFGSPIDPLGPTNALVAREKKERGGLPPTSREGHAFKRALIKLAAHVCVDGLRGPTPPPTPLPVNPTPSAIRNKIDRERSVGRRARVHGGTDGCDVLHRLLHGFSDVNHRPGAPVFVVYLRLLPSGNPLASPQNRFLLCIMVAKGRNGYLPVGETVAVLLFTDMSAQVTSAEEHGSLSCYRARSYRIFIRL